MFQASIGFGANLIAQPIVYQFEPDLVPGSVLVSTATLSCLVLVRERDAVEFRAIGVSLAGSILGIGIGIIVVGSASNAALAILIAVCVLAMVAVTAFGPALPRTKRNLFGAGAAGGFGSLTAGIGGPPLALLFASADGPETRSFLSGFFLVASAFTFAGLAVAGRFGVEELVDGLVLVPAAVIGYLLSNPLLPLVDRGATRPAILVVSTVAAVTLLARTLLGE